MPSERMTGEILKTKLYVPPARPNHVPRPRLVDKLAAGLGGKLTLLSALPGSGKTTLLAPWRAGRSPGCRWTPATTTRRVSWPTWSPPSRASSPAWAPASWPRCRPPGRCSSKGF